MIVPGDKLIIWAAFLALTSALAAGPLGAWPAVVLAVPLVILAVVEAIRGKSRLKGLVLELPPLIRLTKDREANIELFLTHENKVPRRVRLSLAWPVEINSSRSDLTVELGDPGRSSVQWPCSGRRRGRYWLETCEVEIASPWGLWLVRGKLPARAEIRVYPNIFSEKSHVAAIFLNRGMTGIHAQRQLGQGREFEELRDYLPGDSYEDINWKATAKRGRPVTRVYQLERTQEVYLAIDASRLSGRPATIIPEDQPENSAPLTTIFERFITGALVVGLAARRQGDLFGLISFSDRVQGFVRANNGVAHYNACREHLYALEPQALSPDFSEVFAFIGGRLRRRALIFFLTSLDDPVLAEAFIQNIHVISRRHLVVVGMIPPPAARPLFTSEDARTSVDLYRFLGGHFLWTGLMETEKILKKKKVGFFLLDHERLSAQLVSQYLSVKQRQAL